MNKTALITGATSGIGEALTHQFAKNDYDLVLVGESQAALSEVARELQNKHSVEGDRDSQGFDRRSGTFGNL